MSSTIPLKAREFLAPKYWPMWLGMAFIRLGAALPLRAMQAFGGALGLLAWRLMASRRRVARINIRQAYPDYSEAEIRVLNRESFRHLGISVFETGLAWWGNSDYLKSICEVEGREHLDAALAKGKGAILLSGHFATLEIGALLAGFLTPINGVYKKAHNPMFNAFMAHYRSGYGEELIENKNVRALVRGLRKGRATWFAPDQDFAEQDIVFTPFLGGIASTLTGTARLAEMTGAEVVPFYPQRLPKGRGYRLVILPALENFPSGDIQQDSARINRAIEDMVYANPEQYGWVHKRFKTRPPGAPPLY
jgi:KDO2-lipid IV(A) lauroyltransferase